MQNNKWNLSKAETGIVKEYFNILPCFRITRPSFMKYNNSTSNWSDFTRRQDSKVARLNIHRHFFNESPSYKFSPPVFYTTRQIIFIIINPVFSKFCKIFKSISKNQTEKPNKSVVHKRPKLQTCLKGGKFSTPVGALVKKPAKTLAVWILINDSFPCSKS